MWVLVSVISVACTKKKQQTEENYVYRWWRWSQDLVNSSFSSLGPEESNQPEARETVSISSTLCRVFLYLGWRFEKHIARERGMGIFKALREPSHLIWCLLFATYPAACRLYTEESAPGIILHPPSFLFRRSGFFLQVTQGIAARCVGSQPHEVPRREGNRDPYVTVGFGPKLPEPYQSSILSNS